MPYRIISQILVFLLMVDAAWVAVGLYRKKNVQWFIVAYWIILTLKNMNDFINFS